MNKLDKIREAKDIIRKLLNYEKMAGTDTDTSLHGRAEAFLDEDTPKEGENGGSSFPREIPLYVKIGDRTVATTVWSDATTSEFESRLKLLCRDVLKDYEYFAAKKKPTSSPPSKDSPTQEAAPKLSDYCKMYEEDGLSPLLIGDLINGLAKSFFYDKSTQEECECENVDENGICPYHYEKTWRKEFKPKDTPDECEYKEKLGELRQWRNEQLPPVWRSEKQECTCCHWPGCTVPRTALHFHPDDPRWDDKCICKVERSSGEIDGHPYYDEAVTTDPNCPPHKTSKDKEPPTPSQRIAELANEEKPPMGIAGKWIQAFLDYLDEAL